MAARIRSLRNGIDQIDEQSRNDLVIGDVVSVSSIDGATTYAWTLTYVPEGSSATFSGSSTAISPGSFTVDKDGPYMVRLVVDSGLGTESTQYVRLRALTVELSLTLVAAGERRDGTGVIPVDVDPTGWADEQNNNIIALEAAIAAAAGSLGVLSYNKIVTQVPNASVVYQGWAPTAAVLIGVRVKMETLNTVGNYTLTVVNEGTSNTVIDSPPFDMNTLVAGVVQPLTLTGTAADLAFATLDEWTVTLTSDNAGFDGDGIYFELVFNTVTGSGGAIEDLASTLLVGNTTGGTTLIVTNGDAVEGQAAPGASGLDGFDLVLQGGLGDGAGVRGYVQANGRVRGPRTLILTQDDASDWAPSAGQGAYYVSTGSSGRQDNTPYFVDDSSVHMPLLGGAVDAAAQAITTTVTLARGIRLFSPSITASAVVTGDLPAANTMRGVILAVEHRGDSTGTLTMDPAGADTIGGVATRDVDFGTSVLLASDGITDWRVLEVGEGGGAPFIQKNVTELPLATFRYEGWASLEGVVAGIRVRMGTLNTTGNYTATFTNDTTGQTLLTAATFDMNTLVAGDVTSLVLTTAAADLTFAALDEWSAEFTSDNAGFDGEDIYFDIVWGTSGSITFPTAGLDWQKSVNIVPGGTFNLLFFAPAAITITDVKIYTDTAPTTAGVYTLEVEDIDGSNNLLSVATYDMTTTSSATLTGLGLTGTTADLSLAEGTRVRCQFVSDNGDLTGSGHYIQIIYRLQ